MTTIEFMRTGRPDTEYDTFSGGRYAKKRKRTICADGFSFSAQMGELLYSTHCLACHNTQVHWREKKLATDWASLQAEVRRWQQLSKLDWSEYDVEVVTGYLNDLHYRYPPPN